MTETTDERRRTTRPPSPLALLRLRSGLTQQQVAEAIGRDRSHLSRLERGMAPIDAYVGRLAQTYEVSEERVREAWEAARGDEERVTTDGTTDAGTDEEG